MPERATEIEHLAQADDHISRGQKAVADLDHLLATEVARGADMTQSSGLLLTARETLAQFHVHRDLIVQTIADIDAGRL